MLGTDRALKALRSFILMGGGELKLFGGEPLLEADTVRAVIAQASTDPQISRVYLSTNGLGLDEAWLALVRDTPKLVLTLSLDGRPGDHRRFRRALGQTPDAYDHLMGLLPSLLRTPRLVVTMTIPPASADSVLANFQHLRGLGFHRFNLLPGYYLPWRPEQLAALRRGFDALGDEVLAAWEAGQSLYLRNLFTRAPTPFFNTGVIVDADGRVHPSNVGLSGKLDHLLERTSCGTVEDWPSPEVLATKANEINPLLESVLEPEILASTRAVDSELTALVNRLAPAWFRHRRMHRRPEA